MEKKSSETDKIIDGIQKDVSTVTNTVKNLQETQQRITEETTDSVFDELRERENRKPNLVIHNLVEPDGNLKTGLERKEADLEMVKKIFTVIGCGEDLDDNIKFSSRIGEKGENSTNPRPFLMGFKDIKLKERILHNARKLAGSEYSEISLVPDLTQRQRKEENELRSTADKRNSEMNEQDSLNWEWKVIGPRGDRRLIRVRRQYQDGRITQERGRGRGRGQMRGQGRDRGRGHPGGRGERDRSLPPGGRQHQGEGGQDLLSVASNRTASKRKSRTSEGEVENEEEENLNPAKKT